jgi:gamma-glutamylcyclotransferase (GGCT)/AIG2-like uncharacterized protein YtfP
MIPLAELDRLLRAANAWRHAGADPADAPGADAAARLDELFAPAERLVVYGSLAPGRANHHVVAPLGGTWEPALLEGELATVGWGVALGHLALRLRAGGPPVAAHLLTAPALRGAWDALDAFEGSEYRRSLAPVWSADGARRLLAVANVYEAAAG